MQGGISTALDPGSHPELTCSVVAIFVAGVLGWLAVWRHVYWIEVGPVGGQVRWGRGTKTLADDDGVASFHAELATSKLGGDRGWAIVAYGPEGRRSPSLGRGSSVSYVQAIRCAWLLNQALAQCPSGEASSSR